MNKKMSEVERRAFVEEFAVTTVALAISDAIANSGITQRELAERLNVSEARVSQIANGTGNPTIKSLARLADVLGRELRIDLSLDSHVPAQDCEWELSGGVWADCSNDEAERSEQEQYVAVAA